MGRRARFSLVDGWAGEYLSLAASLVSLVVIVILLAHFDHRPIFDTGAVTLNAVLSVFSTISKGWLLLAVAEALSQWKWIAFAQRRRRLIEFEKIHQASRGPFGSVRMLFTRSGASLASIGAAITILAIAIDPFMQQLLQFETKLTPEGDFRGRNATINLAKRFSKGSEFAVAMTGEPGSQRQDVRATADFSIQANVLFGLVKDPDTVAQQVTYRCPSGSCDYELFQSLAVCSKCNNVTDQITIGKPSVGAPMWVFLAESNPPAAQGNVSNATLPNGLYINAFDGWEYGDELQVLMTTQSTGDPQKTMTLKDYDALLYAITFLKIEPDAANSSAAWPNLPLLAQECGLYYCVQEFNTSIVNGSLVTNTTEVKQATRSRASWLPLNPDQQDDAPPTLDFQSPRSSIKRSDLMLGDHFNVSQSAVDGTSAYMQDTFERPNSTASGISGAVVNMTIIEFSPPAMQALYNTPSLDVQFGALAAAMTNAMRNNADDVNPAHGVNNYPVTFYKVQWAWMALPFVLLIAATLFVMIAQVATKRVGIPVWKSNALAVLSRGQQAKGILSGAYLAQEMEEKSKNGFLHFFEREMVVEGGSNAELRRMDTDGASARSHDRQPSGYSLASAEEHDLYLEPRVYERDGV